MRVEVIPIRRKDFDEDRDVLGELTEAVARGWPNLFSLLGEFGVGLAEAPVLDGLAHEGSYLVTYSRLRRRHLVLVASLALFGRGSFGGRFRSLKSLSAYATALLHSLKPKPKIDDLSSMLATLQSLYAIARDERVGE